MLVNVLLAAAVLTGTPAPKESPEGKLQASKPSREQLLLVALQKKLPIDKPFDNPLREILDYLDDVASPPGYERDAALQVRIIPDDTVFKALKGENYKVEDQTVRLPGRMTGATLETVLECLCDQLDATFVVRRDFIEITTFQKAVGRQPYVGELPRLVHQSVTKEPLDEALSRLARRYSRTIVVAPQAAEKAAVAVSARLMNVPFDTAVEILAELAELSVVRRDNALLVTTPERARKLREERKEPARPEQPPRIGVSAARLCSLRGVACLPR